MDILFLAGHDAFRCFAVLTIPVFYLNMHGRRRRMPGLLPSVLGISIVWLFVWYAAARYAACYLLPAAYRLPPLPPTACCTLEKSS